MFDPLFDPLLLPIANWKMNSKSLNSKAFAICLNWKYLLANIYTSIFCKYFCLQKIFCKYFCLQTIYCKYFCLQTIYCKYICLQIARETDVCFLSNETVNDCINNFHFALELIICTVDSKTNGILPMQTHSVSLTDNWILSLCAHWEKLISFYFQNWNMIVLTVFSFMMNQIEFNWVQKQKRSYCIEIETKWKSISVRVQSGR